jgi:hypothetical protein
MFEQASSIRSKLYKHSAEEFETMAEMLGEEVLAEAASVRSEIILGAEKSGANFAKAGNPAVNLRSEFVKKFLGHESQTRFETQSDDNVDECRGSPAFYALAPDHEGGSNSTKTRETESRCPKSERGHDAGRQAS